MKFFICAVAFNGSDGHKLQNLNDLYEDNIIRDEEPCRRFDEKSRYSCEPTPFLVSACLVKKLKRHLQPGHNVSKLTDYQRRHQSRGRPFTKKSDVIVKDPQSHSTLPIVSVSKTVTIISNNQRNNLDKNKNNNNNNNNDNNQLSKLPSPNVSVLKQLLLGTDYQAIQITDIDGNQPESKEFDNKRNNVCKLQDETSNTCPVDTILKPNTVGGMNVDVIKTFRTEEIRFPSEMILQESLNKSCLPTCPVDIIHDGSHPDRRIIPAENIPPPEVSVQEGFPVKASEETHN